MEIEKRDIIFLGSKADREWTEKIAKADLFSSLHMPSGVAPLTVLSPENGELAADIIIGLNNPAVQEKVIAFQNKKREELEIADYELQNI